MTHGAGHALTREQRLPSRRVPACPRPTPGSRIDATERPRARADRPRPPLRRAHRAAGVNAPVPAGATLAVFGPNGAGKTTLLRMLATLLRPHGGERRACSAASCPTRAGRCAGGSACSATSRCSTATSPVARTCATTPACTTSREERIATLLDAGAMARRADEPVRMLSRGMVQRLAVCRAVLHDPELLLLDEPRVAPRPGGGGARRAAGRPRLGAGAHGSPRRVWSRATTPIGGAGAEADLALGLRGAAASGSSSRPNAVRIAARRGGALRDEGARRAAAQGPAARAAHRRVRARDGLFAVTTFVIFHFALDRDSVAGDLARGRAVGHRPVRAVLGINRLFVAEREQGGFDGFLLAPVDRTAMLRRQGAALFVVPRAVELVAVPAFAVLLLEPAPGPATRRVLAALRPTSASRWSERSPPRWPCRPARAT